MAHPGPPRPPEKRVRSSTSGTIGTSPHIPGLPRSVGQLSIGPPVEAIAVMGINLLASTLCLRWGGLREVSVSHFIGFAFGMFGSVLLLGWFRFRVNRAKGSGSFSDWRVSSLRLASTLTSLTWVVSAGNLFVICYEVSRFFT
jgi:hypothetical protein